MNWTDFMIAIRQGLIPSKKELEDGYLKKSGGTVNGSVKADGIESTDGFVHSTNKGKLHLFKFVDSAGEWGSQIRDYKADGSFNSLVFQNTNGIAWGTFDANGTKNGGGDILHTGNMANHVLPKNGGALNNELVVLLNGNTEHPKTRVLTDALGSSFLINSNTDNTKMRGIAIHTQSPNVNTKNALEYQYTDDGVNWGIHTLLHTGNINDQILHANTLQGLMPVGDGTRGVPYIGADYGIMEIGSMIDFHTASGQDFKVRLSVTSNGSLYLSEDGGSRGGYTLHTGNSAKVAIQSTAPSDTSSLWVW